jgi:hypothetical protein
MSVVLDPSQPTGCLGSKPLVAAKIHDHTGHMRWQQCYGTRASARTDINGSYADRRRKAEP